MFLAARLIVGELEATTPIRRDNTNAFSIGSLAAAMFLAGQDFFVRIAFAEYKDRCDCWSDELNLASYSLQRWRCSPVDSMRWSGGQ